MKKEMISLLNAFYYNAALGADAIGAILSSAKDEDFQLTLYRQLQYYRQQASRLTEQMHGLYEVPTEPGSMLRLWMDLMIRCKTLYGLTDERLAKMMMQGSQMGIIQLVRALNHSGKVPERLHAQGEKILEHEQAFINELKPFL